MGATASMVLRKVEFRSSVRWLTDFCTLTSLGRWRESGRASRNLWVVRETISIGLRSGGCGGQVIWCSTPSLLLGQIALTQPGGVLGHCPVEKQMIVPLNANQMGWHIAAECCGSHAGCVPWILNKLQIVSSAKHPHTSSSMLHGGNHTCWDHPFTYSASYKDTAVGTKNLKFGFIRTKERFPPV